MKRILLVFGTRPEAIKMLPVANALAREPKIEPIICVTGQHREMLDSVLSLFQVQPQFDLNIMRQVQGLEQITSAVLEGVGRIIDQVRPDHVLVHGDTSTAMAAALASFYKKVTVGHVEAGLRSGDMTQPWPEEANRRIATVLSKFHFAPTQVARSNLLAEGVPSNAIFVTGNTVIDALHSAASQLRDSPALGTDVASGFGFLSSHKPILLVTGHRRENFGEPFRNICEAIRDLAATGRIQVVYPLHLNPSVRVPVTEVLGDLEDVHLLEPLDYLPFVYLMQRAAVVLTDSGGIQEEAPSLGTPVLVMRNVTERPEAVAAGLVRLVGTDRSRIVSEVLRQIDQRETTNRKRIGGSPYGDGRASERIVDALLGRHVEEFTAIDL